tara:strand:- start:343 stop:525 length:183 start_codon:yes stop_codon:yes gene_type:complete
MNKYNDGQYTIGDYIIWVGGVANYFSDYDKAIKEYIYWLDKNYNDVIIETITSEEGEQDV